MLTIEQLTSVDSQMTLKGASHTACIMANAVKLNMKAMIENPSVCWAYSFVHYLKLAANLHFNDIADSLNTEDPNYPDFVATIDTMREQVEKNFKELGFGV